MTLPYAGPAMDGWPSVVVDDDGVVAGGRRFPWSDLDPHICRADGDRDQRYLEMRALHGEEIRVYCPDFAAQERLQHSIVPRQAGLTRADIPNTGERAMLLDNDGRDTGVVGVVIGYHRGCAYVDTPEGGPGGRPLRGLRRLRDRRCTCRTRPGHQAHSASTRPRSWHPGRAAADLEVVRAGRQEDA